MTENAESSEPMETVPPPARPPATARLTPAQEDEAVHLAKELLLSGSGGIPAAVDALVTFPWNVGVTAVVATWPDLQPDVRELLLHSLSEQKSDAGKRLRLSIARGLFAVDPEAVEKIATDVCRDMRVDGAMSARDCQTFANVFVGKGKPWLQNLAVGSWGAPEPVIACAVEVCFDTPCAPFTQLALVRWLSAIGWLAKLDENQCALIAKAVKRWSSRFKNELKKEVPELPAAIAEVVPDKGEETEQSAESADAEPMSEEDEARAATGSAVERMVASTRGERRAAPRERRESGAAFDLNQALRQIEAHVTSLRKELHEARTLAQREGGGRGRSSRRERGTAPEETPADVEALQRHNAQLEETVSELRHRLEELASDHEDRAAAASHGGDDRAQLTNLLGLKLRESYDAFQALRSNAADEVVREHFADMLETIFKVLEEEGVRLH